MVAEIKEGKIFTKVYSFVNSSNAATLPDVSGDGEERKPRAATSKPSPIAFLSNNDFLAYKSLRQAASSANISSSICSLFLASSAAADADDNILGALVSVGIVRISNERLKEGSRDLDLLLEFDR